MTTTCAWILPSTAPRPKRRATASVADVGRLAEPRGVARLDLVSQRRALADTRSPGSRAEAARLRAATVSIAGERREPAGREIALDDRAGRGSRAACAPGSAAGRRGTAARAPSSRRRANSFSSIRSQTLKMKTPPGAQHATRLRERLRLVGEEHRAELADDRVERAVLEGQLHRVGLAPLDGARGADRRPRGRASAWFRSVATIDDARGQRRRQRARDHARAGRDLEHARGRPRASRCARSAA